MLDYSPVEDLVFADLNLDGEDYEAFEAVYTLLAVNRCLTTRSSSTWRPTIFLRGIASRGREYEVDFPREYLERLSEAYAAREDELGQSVGRVEVAREHSRDEVAKAVQAELERLRR